MSKRTHDELYELMADTHERVLRIEKAVFTGNGEPPILSRLSALEEGRHRTTINASGIASLIAALVAGALSYFGVHR